MDPTTSPDVAPTPAAAGGGCPFPHQSLAPAGPDAAPATCPFTSGRTPADVRMRRLLRIPDGPRASAADAEGAFSKSVFISAARCLFTYLLLPLLGPVLGLTGSVGPSLGLAVGTVSIVAIVASIRRFFRADHRWRWRYTAIGGGIIVLLLVQSVIDVSDLAG